VLLVLLLASPLVVALLVLLESMGSGHFYDY